MGELASKDYQLFLGDCLDVMPTLEAGSVDLILADLPYGTTACKWDSIIPLDALWAAYKRLLKPRGAVVLTASQPFTTTLISSNREWFRYEWVWSKTRAAGFMNARYMPLKTHETVLIFSASKVKPNQFTDEHMLYNPQGCVPDGGIKRTGRISLNTLITLAQLLSFLLRVSRYTLHRSPSP
jgi:site-specific DNA-methyltransferase (adenine-specific)